MADFRRPISVLSTGQTIREECYGCPVVIQYFMAWTEQGRLSYLLGKTPWIHVSGLFVFKASLEVGTRVPLGDGAETVQPIRHSLSSVGISLSCPHLWISGKRSAEEIPEHGGGFHGCEPNGEISAESIVRRDPSDLKRASPSTRSSAGLAFLWLPSQRELSGDFRNIFSVV